MSRRPDDGAPWAPRDPSLRIGDAERNQVAQTLSEHYSEGRIDDAELKERLDRAMRAKTGADLAGLLTDLPPGRGQAALPAPRRRRHVGTWVLLVAVVLAVWVPVHAALWPLDMWAPRIPWLLVGIVAFVLWRRSRHHHVRREPV